MLANPLLSDPTFLRLMALRRKKRLAREAHGPSSSQTPQTDDALYDYVCKTWGVAIPRRAVCPGHCAPFQFFADAYFARHSMLLLKGSRGLSGKSFMLATLGATMAATQQAEVVILGGSGGQSANVHEYMRRLWNAPNAPSTLLAEPPLTTETRLVGGHKIKAIPASSTAIRGLHPEKLLLDEIDEMALSSFDDAMGLTMARGETSAVTVMASTHHYPQGTMSEVIKRAKARHWGMYEYCLQEALEPHGWLKASEVDRKRSEMTDLQWKVEVELQQPSGEDLAILPQAVQYMFQRGLGEFEGRLGEYLEIEAPDPQGRYAHGADWAKSIDRTELVTLRVDVTPCRLVAYEALQRLPWPQMVARFNARIERYGISQSTAAHDSTGIGGVVEDYLIWPAESIVMVGKTRSDLFSQYISAIERGAIVSPYIASLHAQYEYCRRDDLYGSGHPPDGFVAGAMAWRARGNADSGISF